MKAVVKGTDYLKCGRKILQWCNSTLCPTHIPSPTPPGLDNNLHMTDCMTIAKGALSPVHESVLLFSLWGVGGEWLAPCVPPPCFCLSVSHPVSTSVSVCFFPSLSTSLPLSLCYSFCLSLPPVQGTINEKFTHACQVHTRDKFKFQATSETGKTRI